MGLRFPIFERGFELRPVWNLGTCFTCICTNALNTGHDA